MEKWTKGYALQEKEEQNKEKANTTSKENTTN